MDREKALALVERHVANVNLVRHMLAAEVIMRRLAVHFGEDEALWALSGLLHDLDYDNTATDPARHGHVSAEMLEFTDVAPEVVHAILGHAEKVERKSRMDVALYVTDPLTGFLVACALMTADKKLASVDTGFALRRFKEKSFARGAKREQMLMCQDLGLSLEDFVTMGLESMQAIASDLGL